MTVVGYRERTTGQYPLTVSDIRRITGAGFGDVPTLDVLNLANVDPVEDSPVPSYDPLVSRPYEGPPQKVGKVWKQLWQFEPVVRPDPEPEPEPAPVITYKADVWRRASDQQADIIDSALEQLSTRQRRLFDDSQYLDHADPMFGMLHGQMVAAFGETETDRILAPSE